MGTAENKTDTATDTVIDGLTIRLDHDGEPMVLDTELAERLGYARPRVIRNLIRRLVKEEFISDSDICRTVRRSADAAGRGQPATEYWLTESGALDVVLASRTPTARALYRQVKQVFMAWRHGRLAPANTNGAGLPAEDYAALQQQMLALQAEVAAMRDGCISGPRLAQLRNDVRRLAALEHAARKWKSPVAARADIYREMGQWTGWGGRGQPWFLLPAPLAHAAFTVLRGREAAIRREIRVLAADRQARLPHVPEDPPAEAAAKAKLTPRALAN